MTDIDRLKYLRVALVLFGLIMLVALYPLTVLSGHQAGYGIQEANRTTSR
jgi:hypothetical protein